MKDLKRPNVIAKIYFKGFPKDLMENQLPKN